jgi:hypothetical protein
MKKQVVAAAILANKDVQKYISEFVDKGPEKSARALAKGYSRDAKLNNFIKASESGFEKGNSFYLDKERRQRVFDACNHVGVTSIEAKQGAAIAIVQSDIDFEVARKISEVTAKGTLKLNGEQKAALETASKAYRKFLIDKLIPSVQDMLSHELCAMEEKEVEEKEAAVAEVRNS